MGFYLLERASNNGTQWQQWGYPRRGANLSGTVIMHTSESVLDIIGDDSGAEDCAAFIGRRTGYGSYHDLVDSNSIVEMVPFEYEAWQDSETNPWAVGISAACRTSDWATMGDAKREGYYRNLAWCAADFVKYMRTKGIEVERKRISGAEARARKPGFCAHGDSGIARSDPGRDFDWARFFRYTDEALTGTAPHGNIINNEDEKMLVIAKQIDDNAVWIGDGVIRRWIPNPDVLNDLRWCHNNGLLKIWKGGEIAEFHRIDAIGRNIESIPGEVLNADLEWYGFDGNIPTEGRKTTTLRIQAGWVDTQVSTIAGKIDKVKEVVDSFEVGKVELTESDLAHIVEELKKQLAPGLAAELAKRLAE